MKYRTMRFIGGEENVSLLGLGCMRFPLNEDGTIDEAQAEAMIGRALNAGINYIDTAYPYHKGESEPFLGRALKKYPRNSFYLATKLPVWLVNSVEDAERLFKEQLSRLQTKYIDYYLLHALDAGRWEKLVKEGIIEWAEAKKASGKIRHLGFSFHDTYPVFREILTYRQWDFCQIQYNYMDEHSQAGVDGLRYAHARGIPVIIMEPLRGGRLVNLLPESAKELFAQDEEHRTPAELALKWLYDQPEVTCVLSGMNSMEMVEQNVRTASEYGVGCMTESDRALVEAVRQEITKHVKVGCTGCGYCMPCPRGVDIPGTFRCYNAMYSEGKKSGRRDYLQCTAFRKNPASASQCVGCGKCEQHCPQHIEIRGELKAAAGELETVKYKFMKTAIGVLKLW